MNVKHSIRVLDARHLAPFSLHLQGYSWHAATELSLSKAGTSMFVQDADSGEWWNLILGKETVLDPETKQTHDRPAVYAVNVNWR